MNIRFLLYSLAFLSGFIFPKAQFEENEILNVDEAFIMNSRILKNKIFISWEIKPGYYLYKKSISIIEGNNTLKHEYDIKNESTIFDDFFGESLIYKNKLSINANLLNIGLNESQDIKIIYQGCAEGKYCYPKRIKSL
ncbi:MAG: hypothetical protein CMD68_05665 [Gammaproteobacteria bacterium]|nr:hypothetical protein [Gammaproteobacteria bacterium]